MATKRAPTSQHHHTGKNYFLLLRYSVPLKDCSTVEPRLSGPRLSGLFLWSQFSHEYLLVTIKIRTVAISFLNHLKVWSNVRVFFTFKQQKQFSHAS